LIESKAFPEPMLAQAGVATEKEEQLPGLDYVFIDTPGQIEVFTWSAGGQIIHEVSTENPQISFYFNTHAAVLTLSSA
jgi:hypothetical protein